MNNTRFVAGTSPVLMVTKWHDLEQQIMFYDLYINGKIDNRYNLEGLMQRINEVVFDI